MARTVAILQPNYIPWRGYFDLMAQVDEFIIYDDTQYTRRDWRNRNKISLNGAAKWLTIPVDVSGKYTQPIKDTRIAETSWQNTHPAMLRQAYARAPYFNEVWDMLALAYQGRAYEWLLEADMAFLELVKDYLGLSTRLRYASDYNVEGGKTDKLVALCQAANASTYISGPAAKAYIEAEKFSAAGITLSYIDYPAYPSYPHTSFYDQHLSILDALFHCGRNVAQHLGTPERRRKIA